MSLLFWFNLIILLVAKFEAKHYQLLKFHDFRLLAMDRTSIQMPRWMKLRNNRAITNASSDSPDRL